MLKMRDKLLSIFGIIRGIGKYCESMFLNVFSKMFSILCNFVLFINIIHFSSVTFFLIRGKLENFLKRNKWFKNPSCSIGKMWRNRRKRIFENLRELSKNRFCFRVLYFRFFYFLVFFWNEKTFFSFLLFLINIHFRHFCLFITN